MKRLSVLMLSAVLVVGILLSGCSNPQSSGAQQGSGDKTAVAPSKPVDIEWWTALGGRNNDIIQEFVKQFNESQKEVHLTAIYQGNYFDTSAKLQAAVASDSVPHICQIEVGAIAQYADVGALEDLKSFIDKDKVDVNDFVPGLYGYSVWKDKIVALPFNRSTPLFYYNKKHFAEAGLDLTGPKTWDDIRAFAKKLTIKDKRWGYSCPIDIWFYEAMLFQNDGLVLSADNKHLGFDRSIGAAPIEYWKALIDEGTMKVPPGKEYNSWDVAKQDFLNEVVSMIVVSTGDVRSLVEGAKGKFEVGTCFLPKSKDYGVPTGGANIVMMTKKPKAEKDAAWKAMKWLTDTKQTAKYSQDTGYMPSRQSAINSPEMQEFFKTSPQFKTAIDQLKYTDKKRPMHPGYPQLNNLMMNEIQKAVIDRSYTTDMMYKTMEEGVQKFIK